MAADNVLYWIIYFIVTVLVAWIAFSLILMWFRPALYNPNGSVNWWNALWVAALIIIFAWIIMIILSLLISFFNGMAHHKEADCIAPKAADCITTKSPDTMTKPVDSATKAEITVNKSTTFNPAGWMF